MISVPEDSSMGKVGRTPFSLSRLKLTDFRNYASVDITLCAGLNLAIGPNGQGKTNLLEAIFLLGTSRLLRGSRDAEAVRESAVRARVEGTLAEFGTELAIELEAGTRKRATLNGVGLKRASDLMGRLPVVAFSASDLPVVAGQPTERRLFLDLHLSQLYPAYREHLTQYKRALEQRNALLKLGQERPVAAEVFESWEALLAEHGACLRDLRIAFLADVEREASRAHAELADGERLGVTYGAHDGGGSAETLSALLAEQRRSDIARGSTGVGPHRDDLCLMIEGREARHFGSQGQQRTAVVSLKLAVLACAERILGAPPLLLLDDVFSDLDKVRQNHLLERVRVCGSQVLLTCTDAAQVGSWALEAGQVMRVLAGTVTVE